MQAKIDTRAAEMASLLESFGIELSAGGLVVMTDFVWWRISRHIPHTERHVPLHRGRRDLQRL